MLSIARVLEEGGIFTYLVIASALVGLAIDLLQFILLKKASLWPLVLGSVAGTIILACLGSVHGMIMAARAIEMATPEMKAALLARGGSIALTTTWMGLLLAGIHCFLGSIACTIRENLKR